MESIRTVTHRFIGRADASKFSPQTLRPVSGRLAAVGARLASIRGSLSAIISGPKLIGSDRADVVFWR